MFVHQFVHALNFGDAISGEAITIKRLLSSLGIECRIYSLHSHPKVKEHVTPWEEFERYYDAQAGDHSILLHYSIASPLNDLYAKTTSAVRAILYHNLTPVSWFAPYNARVANDLRIGYQELPALVELSDIVLADSTFNKSELEKLGCRNCAVLPLPLDFQKWEIAANPGIASILKSSGVRNFLHVGRLAPNKCIEDILKIFYFYHHKIDENSKLWLIGHDVDTEIYSLELSLLVRSLRLEKAVEFVGTVADSELKSFYQESDCYFCMSEHEGFCVPVLEAMRFGLPVIAYNSTALPETLGNAGILVDRKSHAELAELTHVLLNDQQLRTALVEAGEKRAELFAEPMFLEALESQFLSKIASVVGTRASQVAKEG